MKKYLVIFAVLLFAVSFAACGVQAEPEPGLEGYEEFIEEIPEPEPPVELLISAVGDVMMHLSQINAQRDDATGTFDFNNNFVYIKKYIQESDLAMFNLETTFAGSPYTGFPLFSAPDALAPALKSAGFDVAVFANNHVIDKGIAGFRRTLEVLRENRFMTTGGRLSSEWEPRFVIAEVKGVNIAVIGYTYASSSASGQLLVNGLPVPRGEEGLINYFRYEHLDTDLANIKETVDEARAAGADVVILYYHWGSEYQLTSNQWQRTIAERSVKEMGADIILGAHPHVLQEVGFFFNERTGLQVPVFYSMGNFISNQRRETLPTTQNNRHTETGIIARINILFDVENRRLLDVSVSAIPTWVDRHTRGGRHVYHIIPLDEELENNPTLAQSGQLSKAKAALDDAIGILGL